MVLSNAFCVFFQVDLPLIEQERIMGELRLLPELCDCLATLDIAIGFLISIGGNPDTPLTQFLSQELRLKTPTSTASAYQNYRQHGRKQDKEHDVMTRITDRCCLQHARSLWLTLSRHKASMLHRQGQIPLDNIPEKYRKPLDQNQVCNYTQL